MRETIASGNQLWLEFESREERVKALNLPYIENPVNDNDVLLNLQYDLIVNNSSKAEAEIWMLCETVCRRLVRKKLKADGIRLPRDTQENIAALATEYFCRRFTKYRIRKNQFYYVRNFIVQLEYAVIHALYIENNSPDDMYDSIVRLNGKRAPNGVTDVIQLLEKNNVNFNEENKKLRQCTLGERRRDCGSDELNQGPWLIEPDNCAET